MKIDIKRVAKLANLPLTEEEKKNFENQLSSTLETIADLNEIDTKGIEPTSQVTGLTNVTRGDETKRSLTQEQALLNAKKTHNGLFEVDAILDNE